MSEGKGTGSCNLVRGEGRDGHPCPAVDCWPDLACVALRCRKMREMHARKLPGCPAPTGRPTQMFQDHRTHTEGNVHLEASKGIGYHVWNGARSSRTGVR